MVLTSSFCLTIVIGTTLLSDGIPRSPCCLIEDCRSLNDSQVASKLAGWLAGKWLLPGRAEGVGGGES